MNKDFFSDRDGAEADDGDLAFDRTDPMASRRISPRSPRQAIQPEPLPPPPAPSRRARHPLVVATNFVVMTGVIVLMTVGVGLYFGKSRFESVGPLKENRSVMITSGSNLRTISNLLKRHNVIASDFVFSTGVRLHKAENQLKAGEYLFEAGVSMREVMDALISGKAILHAVTIPEGLTSAQVVRRLQDDPMLTGRIVEVPEEGRLLPDTYKFTRGTTRQQILNQMLRARDRVLTEIWGRRAADLPVSSQDEFVTLASIVEKETGRADERPRVASVFINRLRRGMKLQSDPTIIYGLFGGEGKPSDRPIYRSDITKPTPYNTYVIEGLPPGPIANPGRAALEAVANPSRTSDLYFVADGTGGHAFAESLDDHNRNVQRWRRIQAAQAAAAEESAGGDGGSGSAEADEAAPQTQ